MLQLQCTQKTFKILGLVQQDLPDKPNTTPLGVWYANVINLGGINFMLFVNDPTLYVVPICILDTQIKLSVDEIFKEMLFIALVADGVSEKTALSRIDDLDPTIFTKTTSRSMLGSMNDMIYNLHFYIKRDIEVSGVIDLLDIQQRLNRIPQRKIGWKYAVEAMRENLQQR